VVSDLSIGRAEKLRQKLSLEQKSMHVEGPLGALIIRREFELERDRQETEIMCN